MAVFNSYGDWWKRFNSADGGPSLAAALPGNLSTLGPAYLRSLGIEPSAGVNNPGTTEIEQQRVKPPKNYDPNWFRPQGNAPATPSANAAVAAQSQVVRTPQEIAAQYKKEQDALQADQRANRELMKMWNAYKAGPGNFATAVQNELGGRMTAMPAGAPLNEGITLPPSAVGFYRPNVTNGSGQAYLPVPKDFQPWSPGAINGASSVDGLNRTPLINRDYANSLMATLRTQMANGQPVTPSPMGGNQAVTASPDLMQRQGVQDALTKWVSANNYIQGQKLDAFGKPYALDGNNAGTSGSNGAQSKALADSYNQYQQNYFGTLNTNNQAYLDQMGGGFYGGVLPSAQNPQWYDNTPTWGPPKSINRQQGMAQAQNSPWGQAGAPWASQAWAAGTYNPMQMSAAMNAGEGNSETPSAPRWEGQSGMFAPQQGFNPSLVTNSPWQMPRQQNNAFGATNENNKMTFGASPWGSFW